MKRKIIRIIKLLIGLLLAISAFHSAIIIGDYAQGWWYFRKNMIVCKSYPHGVAVVLQHPAKEYKNLYDSIIDGKLGDDDIKGYYGYSHRGGSMFRIGDKLFAENYEPKKEDYTKKQWSDFLSAQEKAIKREMEEGFYDTEEFAISANPISAFISFRLRGAKTIESWEEAKQAAINMSDYLS